MENSLGSRLKHAWNAFMNRDPTYNYQDTGPGYSTRPDRPRLTKGNERTVVTSIYNRIALDASSINLNHCRLDDNGRYAETIDSTLNACLNLEANLDQTGRAFLQDVVMSMLDEGCVAIVPVVTSDNPDITSGFNIHEMRTGKIIEWFPKHVRVRAYNEDKGIQEDIKLAKKHVAIIENPLFAVINEPNSTMQRLVRKLSLLDVADEKASSGKLDIIIQLPYVVKSEARKKEAERRRTELEDQLSGSKLGVAYADGTEKIVQLNRSLENNLLKQIEYLTDQLYAQLGITQAVLNGSANEQEMLNYHNRTIEPIVSAIVDEMKRKFLTKTARSQNQTIMFFRDPFRLAPINSIAEIADKFTRNEIMTSNEIRQVIGMKPSSDPKADQLRNSNMPQNDDGTGQTTNDMEEGLDVEEPEAERERETSIYDIPISEL